VYESGKLEVDLHTPACLCSVYVRCGDLIHHSIVLSCGLVQQTKKMKLQNSKLFPRVGGGYDYEVWTGAG
jgi:hypothetical protein